MTKFKSNWLKNYYLYIYVSRFELDLANNLEVEFLVYSWDPQLRHRLCYRSSLRLSALFSKGQVSGLFTVFIPRKRFDN